MVDEKKEEQDFQVEISDVEGGESQGQESTSRSDQKQEIKSTVEPIMVPLAELQKLRAEKRQLKTQNEALVKVLEAQETINSKEEYADGDLVTYGDLKKLRDKPALSLVPESKFKSPFRVGDEEMQEAEAEFRRYVPDYEQVISKTTQTIAKDPNLLSAVYNADNPAAMAYHLGKQLLAAGALEGTMSDANPAKTKDKIDRIEFNQTLPRNVNRPSGGGHNIMQFTAAEIAALPQDEFNEIWEKMTPTAREKLKHSIQTKRTVGNFPSDMK